MLCRPLAGMILLAVALLSREAGADVLVVDFSNGPGSDFEFLPEALDAAQDGDVLLIRPGHYETWNTVDGRSLTLVADGANVTVRGTLTVRNLGSAQRVVLRGLHLGLPGSLELYDNDGVVYVEDCTILADQEGGAGQYAGLLAVNSRLVLSGSSVAGSLNYSFHDTPPTPGLQAFGSELLITSSDFFGGDGTDPYAASVPGAAGLWLHDSTVSAHDVSAHGGYGDTASGGIGLVAVNGSRLSLLESSAQGGGGAPIGDAQSVDGSVTLLTLPGQAHALSSSSPVREGESCALTLQGAPGDAVWLALSLAPGWNPTGNGLFVLAVGAPFQLVPLGLLGHGGQLVLSVRAPHLPASLEALDVLVQDLYVEAGGGLKVCGPTTVVTLLDGAF